MTEENFLMVLVVFKNCLLGDMTSRELLFHKHNTKTARIDDLQHSTFKLGVIASGKNCSYNASSSIGTDQHL